MVLTLAESWPVLVGKRFLSLSAADRGDGGHDGWDVGRVAEWPWLSGTIRAVSHTDVTKKDLKVKLGPGGLRPDAAGTPLAAPLWEGRSESWPREGAEKKRGLESFEMVVWSRDVFRLQLLVSEHGL